MMSTTDYVEKVLEFLRKIECEHVEIDLESNSIVANWQAGETFYEFDLETQEYRHCGYGGFYTDWEEF